MDPTDKQNADKVQTEFYFPTPIYVTEKPEYLVDVTVVSEENLKTVREKNKLNDVHPLYMSNSYFHDERITNFVDYIGNTAWGILHDQGYEMEDKEVYFTEMWTQEHYKTSSMEQHTHGYGAQIVGFYFLEVPSNPPVAYFHDPRMSKLMIDLPEKNPENVNISSKAITFVPKVGMLIFTNAWLAHSFSRNSSDKPFKFVHFNLNVRMTHNHIHEPEVEIV